MQYFRRRRRYVKARSGVFGTNSEVPARGSAGVKVVTASFFSGLGLGACIYSELLPACSHGHGT